MKRFTQVWKTGEKKGGVMLRYEKRSRGFLRIFSGVRVLLWVFCTFLVGGARIGGFGSVPKSGVRVDDF